MMEWGCYVWLYTHIKIWSYPKLRLFGFMGIILKYLSNDIHYIGKDKTWKIERKNLNFRTHLKRLNRKTICYSRNEEIHDHVIGMYIERYYFKSGVFSKSDWSTDLWHDQISYLFWRISRSNQFQYWWKLGLGKCEQYLIFFQKEQEKMRLLRKISEKISSRQQSWLCRKLKMTFIAAHCRVFIIGVAMEVLPVRLWICMWQITSLKMINIKMQLWMLSVIFSGEIIITVHMLPE